MAWYNSSWLYRQKITVDASYVDEVFSLLPIYTSKLNRHFFDNAKAAAADIRITEADGTTEIARYIVAHDATARTGCIIANASADVSISTNTDYYVYYGNSGASDHATSATYGRDAAFADYAGAYMPGMTTADLTGGGRTLTAVNSPGTAASGYEGITAATYNGTSQYHRYDGTQAVTNWPVTLEAIALSNASAASTYVCKLGSTTSDFPFFALELAGSTNIATSRIRGDSGSLGTAQATVGYSDSTEYYWAGSRDANSGTSTAYQNGGNRGTNTTTVTTPTFSTFAIGASRGTYMSAYLTGRVAVALLSSSVRSADYIATMYDAWTTSAFVTAGAIEAENGGMTGWRLFQTAATTTASGLHQDWSNPNNALSTNVDAATSVLDDTTWLLSETLKLTNPDYGITIPTGEDTYNCYFKILRSGQTSSAREIRDYNIQFIDDAGSLVGTNLKDIAVVWPATAAEKDYTVAGVTLTSTKFDADTGLAIQADGTNTNGATTASVLTAWINVVWESTGGNTGTGALTAPAGTTSGSGVVGKTGTGALTAPAGTTSGSGTQTLDGTGALTAPVGTASGAGVVGKTGTGALTGPAGTVSGTGTTSRTGTGALTAPVATVSGTAVTTVEGSGDLTAPAGEVDGSGTGSGSAPVTGTGELTSPMPLISGDGEIQSGNQTLVGALTAAPGEIDGIAITGKTGTAALVHPMPIVSGSGRSTVSGTGALTAPAPAIINGLGLNSPPGHVGTAGLTAPAGVINGTGYVVGSSDIGVDYISWFNAGATGLGLSQRDQAASLGGFRSSTEARGMTWECRDPMVGVEILAVSAYNGRGYGSLNAVTESTLSWTPPSGIEGTPLTLAVGDETILFGSGSSAWIRVRRNSSIPMSGAHSVQCLDIYNNVVGMGNAPHADAVSGEVYYRAIMGHNSFTGPAINLKIWLDSTANTGIAIGYEAAVAGEIQTIADELTAPTGITWSTGTTSATGLAIASLEAGADFGLWIRRTIAADSDPSPSELVAINIEFEDLATDAHNDALRGKYRIARTDFVTYGLWLGQDAEPDLTAAADEEFATRPHTTTLAVDDGHTYNAVIRYRNKWGLWSQNAVSTPLVMDVGGEQGFVPPTAPNAVAVTQTADNEAIVGARYEPAIDGDNRADIFVLWLTTDDTTPDTTDPPTAYQVMNRRAGIETFKYTGTTELLDATPVKAVVRSRRLAIGAGDAFSPDTTQLPASGAGTIVVDSELAGWDSTGYMKITSYSGALQEAVEYSNLVVGAGISTFTVLSGGRAQWGTTAAATATNTVIYPVTAVDSTNTTTTSGVIDGIAPGRPWGELLFGFKDAQQQDPIAGPDGVTEEYISVPNNHYLLLGEGWCELWLDTDLVWKVFQDGNNYGLNGLYIPSEWDIAIGSVSGAGTGVFESTGATSLYIVAGGTRRCYINGSNMTITVPTLSTLGGLPEAAPQESTWEQYTGSLLQSWDPAIQDYRPYVQLTSAGVMTSEWTVINNLTQSEIMAL